MSTHPYQITAVASAKVNMTGIHSTTIRLPVVDSGTKPLHVLVRVEDVTKFTRQYPAASWVTSIHPATFVLQPGQTEWVRVKIVPPAGAKGTHAFNFLASAAPAGHVSHHGEQGTVAVAGGGTIKVIEPGKATPLSLSSPAPAPTIPASHQPGNPWIGLAALLVLLALLNVAAWGAVRIGKRLARRRRARRVNAEPVSPGRRNGSGPPRPREPDDQPPRYISRGEGTYDPSGRRGLWR